MSEFLLDNKPVAFTKGQTIIQAAQTAGIYIPHLCHHSGYKPHGSCRVCIVEVDGRYCSSCTTPATEGMDVKNISESIQSHRRDLLELLFVEGNHVCPSCEKSGSCTLQSVAEFCGMLSPRFQFQFPDIQIDASHPDFILDLNRCIHCELCVRASRDYDQKFIFSLSGRGIETQLVVNADDGLLGSSQFDVNDKAASICPVGAILPKYKGFDKSIGQRKFDAEPINQQCAKNDR